MQPHDNQLPKQGWSNSHHEIRPSNVYAQAEQFRVNPRYVGTGQTRGNQSVGYGGVQVDGTNNRVNIVDSDRQHSLFGEAPDDQRPGLWIVKAGFDVVDELNAG